MLQLPGAPGTSHGSRPTRASRLQTRALVQTIARTIGTMSNRRRKDMTAWEQQVLALVSNAKGRGKAGLSPEQVAELEAAVAELEAAGGVQDPTADPGLEGKWRLLHTTRPGTASPIQRTFTGVESFSVFQEVELSGDDPRVNNIVDFGESIGYLKVEAQASTDSKPLEGFTPREGSGLLFGLLGKSINYQPQGPNIRIDFQFDKAAFHFKFLPFTLPYPVPFRLLGDERKGWLDVTYMSQDRTFRLSRGNKGTLFVLAKDVPLKAKLMDAIKQGNDDKVLALVDALEAENPTPKPALSPLAQGTWRLVWSQQAPDAGALQKFGSKQANTFQIIDAKTGALRNRVDLTPFVRISARAMCEPDPDSNGTRTNVFFKGAGIVLGEGKLGQPLTIPAPGPNNRNSEDGNRASGYVDWLYLDENLRITRGNKGSLFIHTKESEDASDANMQD